MQVGSVLSYLSLVTWDCTWQYVCCFPSWNYGPRCKWVENCFYRKICALISPPFPFSDWGNEVSGDWIEWCEPSRVGYTWSHVVAPLLNICGTKCRWVTLYFYGIYICPYYISEKFILFLFLVVRSG